MALEKQSVNINFALGLDTKTDPNQIPVGKFLSLKNAVFNKGGGLQKRNGFGFLTSLPDTTYTTLSTFNDNLIALGDSLSAYSTDTNQWINKGSIIPVSLSSQSLVRTATSQQTVDAATSANNLTIAVWKDSDTNYYYKINDSNNGNAIVAQTQLPTGAVLPRVFLLGNYFVITFLKSISGNINLQYLAISTSNTSITVGPTSLSTTVKLITSAYDGQVVDDKLYLAWDASDGGGAVRVTVVNQYLTQMFTFVLASYNAAKISICGDTSGVNPVIWLSFFNASNNAYTMAFDNVLAQSLAPTLLISSISATHITSTAYNNVVTVYYDVVNTYSFSSTRSDYIRKITCTIGGSVGTASTVLRSVQIASKAFVYNGNSYLLAAYGGTYQPTNFLINSSGDVIAKLSYSNSLGYQSSQILPNTVLLSDTVYFGYLFKDQVVALNKDQNASSVGGIYGQLGINLASITFMSKTQTVEIGNSLILSGGIVRMYDGIKPVELGFNLWPEDLGYSTLTTGGSMTAQIYYYVATYEWTDAQGNIHRSAPSIPLEADISASMTSTNTVTVNVPTYRITYKVGSNPVRIVLYRWSTAQQIFYQVTSLTSPTLNSVTTDSVAIIDTYSDAQILGNNILYTTGGVVENIAPPASNALTLNKSRLFLVDAENQNTVWFSKVVVQNTPVETTDLFTKYLAPSISASGNVGTVKALFAMDDKLIAFKKDSIYYMVGNGPDNTGANDDFSEFVFITSTVGCEEPFSLAFMPNGIVFQSDKGRWLLGRDLSTKYYGAPVEDFISEDVSAQTIPGTNQVRIILNDGKVIMYDYYYDQWGEFQGIPAISSTVYQGLHTILNQYGEVLQETPNAYIDGSRPVLLSFTTGWLNLLGLQGYERAYFFYVLGKFYTPHKVQIQIAYDYFDGIVQSSIYTPNNYAVDYGDDPLYGSSSPYGGTETTTEQFRVFLERQKCQAFQITLNEIYDASYGVPAGFGLTLSGMNLVVGAKSKYPRINPSRSIG